MQSPELAIEYIFQKNLKHFTYHGLAMLSCDNLALNFIGTKPSCKNRRFFQSSTDQSN